ncbi:molybdate ABC transporter permease subunit [Bacillus tianshenii]|nr:molybdate ABC transporter permease subunit [Bacillus tianshenii]
MNQYFWEPIQLSLFVSTIATVLVFITGTLLAYIFTRYKVKGKVIWESAFMLPLVLPPSVVGFLLLQLLGRNGEIGKYVFKLFHVTPTFTIYAAIIASAVVSFPLMYQSAKSGFTSIPKDMIEAAVLETKKEWIFLVHIFLPLSKRALLTGVILSLTRGIGEFGATLMFAGNIPGKTQTIPTAIYVAFEKGNDTLAWVYVAVSISLSFFFLWFTTKLQKDA